MIIYLKSPLFSQLSPGVRQRLPFAVRAGICCAMPVLAGYSVVTVGDSMVNVVKFSLTGLRPAGASDNDRKSNNC